MTGRPRLCLSDVNRPQLARKLAGDDYWRLQTLASAAAQNPAHAEMLDELRAEAIASLRRHAATAAAGANELAMLAAIDQQQGDFQSAAKLYRRALTQEYNQVDWRLNLAKSLAAAEQFDDAIHEVRICLLLRPQHAEATALLGQWTTRRKTQP